MSARLGPDIDFKAIAPRGPSKSWAFEEFSCQLAAHEEMPPDAEFTRLRGDGGDGGVECLWKLASGEEWGWQAKYVFDFNGALRQLRRSFDRAISEHPELTRFIACMPFDLSSSTGGRGKSQVDKFEEFRRQAESDAAGTGVHVKVEWWGETALSARLQAIDPEGGRRRYWFDSTVFSRAWFRSHFDQARDLAGPRYTPELHHGHALDEVLAALGGLDDWVDRVAAWAERVEQQHQEWRRSLTGSADPSVPEFPGVARSSGEALLKSLGDLSPLLHQGQGSADGGPLAASTAQAIDQAVECADRLGRKLEEDHGVGAADSAQFRQRSAELMVSFPAIHLDRCREALATLQELQAWLGGAAPRAAREGRLLVVGLAGSGKTHGVCDASETRFRRHLPSIVLFGHRITAGAPLWTQVRDQLGLSTGDWTRSSLFDALDAAGQVAGHPLVVFVDALNESEPRSLWQRELPLLARDIESRSHLRLCVTCRSAYLDQVIPTSWDFPQFVHPGFAGQEFDACTAFFEHFGLEPPVGPLLHPEFANPLFLKLVCQALVANGEPTFPVGWTGIQQVLQALLAARDRELALRHPGIDQHTVTRAMVALASELERQGVRQLPLSEVDAVVTSALPATRRAEVPLLDALEGADLLLREPGPSRPGTFAPSEDRLSIAFDRLRDHLLAEATVGSRGRALSGADRKRVAAAALADPGVAAALSLLLPQRFGIELVDLEAEDDEEYLLDALLSTLAWRSPDSLTNRTADVVRRGLGSSRHVAATLDGLVSLTVRPGHVLDADWFHFTLGRVSMPDRDAVWCRYLHEAFGQRDGAGSSPVVRLLEAAWSSGVHQLDDEVLWGWLTALCWFFAAADRRVRDHATKAAVRIGESRPVLWVDLLEAFIDIDDDYVVERVLAAAYGTLLRTRDATALARASEVIARRFFADRAQSRPNALLRDHARCIGELAGQCDALPAPLTVETFLPPYDSAWPLAVPAEADLERYTSRESRQRFPRLLESCVDTHMGDFAIYTVKWAMNGYTHGLGLQESRRWIFRHVLDMGYTPERFANYDWKMLQVYGGGRGRPKWADRIGKKYQLIALARLVGHVRDNVPWRGSDWDTPEAEEGLQGGHLRDIDPSLLAREAPLEAPGAWWVATRPDFESVAALEDRQWVGLDDFPDPKRLLQPLVDPARPGQTWRLLNGLFKFYDRNDGNWKTPRREIWVWLQGYLLPTGDRRRCWERMRKADFWGRWMPSGWEDEERGFVGEYPRGAIYRWRHEEDEYRDPKMPFPLEPVCNVVNSTYEADAWQDGVIHVHLPSTQLVDWTGAWWDGQASFVSPGGQQLFTDPALAEPGPGCLLADASELHRVLESQDRVLVWSYLAERRIVSSSFNRDYYAGSKHISRALWLDGTTVRASRRPVGEHALPSGEVVRLP